jgi:serine/threonine-protein kinase
VIAIMDDTVRERFFVGDYELTEFIGMGGMGEVYKGVHTRLRREAAIKKLKPTGADQAKAIHRFFNEARIQASLHHPNIATLYDFIEEKGQLYIVMEYVDGETLQERVERAQRLPAPEAVRLFRGVVAAVWHLHGHGIIHRDIKPNNIKINSKGEVKLLDFGIARSVDATKLTTEGKLAGTLPYLAPEQIETGASDARTDIWELGVLFYELVCGEMPFQAAMFNELCVKIVRVQYTPPSKVNPATPRRVEEIIAHCLRKDPAQRYQSAEQLLGALDKLGGAPDKPGGARRRSATREVVVRVINKIQNIVVAPAPPAGNAPPRQTATGKIALAVAVASLLAVIALYLMLTSSPPPAEGLVRTALSCDAPPGTKVFKLLSASGERELLGTCGEDSLHVDGAPSEMIRLILIKNGREVPQDPFEVSDRTRMIHVHARAEEFE